MKLTFGWLKQHLETTASLEEVCDKLTALGLEVEKVEDHGKALAPFIIAEVLTAEKHPNADRLKVTTVDTGKEKLQVVCGAPNCRAGMKTVLARPGDVMPNTGEALKKGVIRGTESQGMLCAADELKLQETETDGIIELPADAPIGKSFAEYGGYNDPVIEIKLTPNRPDCTGVRGIARDLAAAGMGKLKPLDIKPVKGKGHSSIKVKLGFAKGDKACPFFAGRLIRNVKNGPSPAWLQQRLSAIGLRPISALVDITNYMTFACGRPLHVFDAKKIKGDLWVRAAKGGETFKALNGKDYKMDAGMTIIGDDTGMLSLGGIMGGASSSCDDKTTDVFIESALFGPERTAQTGRILQISSDARYRFERGVDPAFTVPGLELATQYVLEFCGTPETIVSENEIADQLFEAKQTIGLDPKKCLRLAGVDVPPAEQEKILVSLGFEVKKRNGVLTIAIPSWRPDIEGQADLVEEIIRIKGYENVTPVSLDRPVTIEPASVADVRSNMARRALGGQGLLEAVTWSFMPSKTAALFGGGSDALRLENPISSDLDVMRPTILANLIDSAKRNADRGFSDVGLFEIGPVFHSTMPDGQMTIATALRAGNTPRHWASPQRAVDAYDAKADAMTALAAAGAPVSSLQVTMDAPEWYHPGRSGTLRLGPVTLATFGEIHPHVLNMCDAAGPMVGCEVFLDVFPQGRGGSVRPLLKLEALQAVTRDFAFVVGNEITAVKLIKAVRDADKIMIRDVSVFDVYEGDKVEAGKKSVALSLTLQPVDKSLTDAEIEVIAQKVMQSVAKATGGSLRG